MRNRLVGGWWLGCVAFALMGTAGSFGLAQESGETASQTERSSESGDAADQSTDGEQAFLGVRVQTLTSALAEANGVPSHTDGALVVEVRSGTPAERAGLNAGDIVVGIGPHDVTSKETLKQFVSHSSPGSTVRLELVRASSPRAMKVELGAVERESRDADGETLTERTHAYLGARIQSITPRLADSFGWPKRTDGVLVTDVRAGSPADDAGLARGDIVLVFDGKRVESSDALAEQVGRLQAGVTTHIRVQAPPKTHTVNVELAALPDGH